MGSLTSEAYDSLVKKSVPTVPAPSGLPRREGSPQRMAEDVASALDALDWHFRHDREVHPLEESCLYAASSLYDAGAPHPLWRYWSGLAGLGYVVRGRRGEAVPYLVLAEQWDSLAALTSATSMDGTLEERCLWRMLGGSGEIGGNRHEESMPWLDLVSAMAAGDAGRTTADLRLIVEYWIGEGEDWNVFRPHSYPSFQPDACAAAAIARRRGLIEPGLPDEILAFLEPGLAEGIPEGLPAVTA